MKLASFRIQNYRSIIDTGNVELSDNDNVAVFAGQNESGKSSILKALRDFEEQEFDQDSTPFDATGKEPIPVVSCTYKVNTNDNIAKLLNHEILESMGAEVRKNLQIKAGQKILNADPLKSLSEFTLIGTKENGKFKLAIDEISFRLFLSSMPDRPKLEIWGKDDNEKNSTVASRFWNVAPVIVFFEDFCDLLPNRISISDLEGNKTDVTGYRAVRSLEKILNTNFVKKNKESDSVRGINEDRENRMVSVDFQKDWGQRIHGANEVSVKYKFQKRDGDGSYINFYVQTKEEQPLPPRNRSKGLIWFLSLWLELRAKDIQNKDLVLMLDEPDQHLHIKAQEDILKLINRLSNQGDQILYATHSPYLIQIDSLNRIKLVLNAETEGTKIESITTSRVDTAYKQDALQPIVKAIGFGVSEFSSLNKKNVILEGVSDFYYFSAMKKLLNKTGDYTLIPGVGLRKINSLISLMVGYGVSWVTIIDDDPEEGGNDSKKKFDEIKDFIFDGDENKTKEKICVLNGIVGVENMFTYDDFKLVGPQIKRSKDMVKVVGQNRKVLFSKLFFEKVNNGEITKDQLSTTAKANFKKAFDFIKQNL